MLTSIMWNSNCISCIGGKSVDIIELGTIIPYSLYDDTVVHTPRDTYQMKSTEYFNEDMKIPSTSMKLARFEQPSTVNISGTMERKMSKTEPERPSSTQDQFESPDKTHSSKVKQAISQNSEQTKISIDNFITEESESEENSICSLDIVSNIETETDMDEENIVDYDADDENEPQIDKYMVTKLPSHQELYSNKSNHSVIDTLRDETLPRKNLTSVVVNNKRKFFSSESDKLVDNVKEVKKVHVDEKETQLNIKVGLVSDAANVEILKDSEKIASKALDNKEHVLENHEIQANEKVNSELICRLVNNSEKVDREIRTKSEDRERRRWRLEILQRSKSFTRKHMTSLTRNMDRNEELDLLKKHIRSKSRRIKPEAQKQYNDESVRPVNVDFSMFNVEQSHNLEPEELKQHNDESQINIDSVLKVEQKDEIKSTKDIEKTEENKNISEPHVKGKRKKKNNFLRSLVKLMDISDTKNKSFENKMETNSETKVKQTDQDKMDIDNTILKDSQIDRGLPNTVDEHRPDSGTTMINVDEIRENKGLRAEKTRVKKEMERNKIGSEKTNDKESRIIDKLKKIKWSDSIEKIEKKEKEKPKVGKEMLSEFMDEMKMVKKIKIFIPLGSERLEEEENRRSKNEFALRSVMNGKKLVVEERAKERQHLNHELKKDLLEQSRKEKKSKKEMEKLLHKEEKLKKKKEKEIETKRKKLETKQNKKTEKKHQQNVRELKKNQKKKEKERQIADKNRKKMDKIDKKMEKMKEKEKQKMDSVNKTIYKSERQKNWYNVDPEMKEKLELEKEIEREIDFCEREKEKIGNVKNWMNKEIFKKKRNNKVGVEIPHKKKIKPEFTRSELQFSPYQRQTPSPPRYKSLGSIRPPFIITPIGARKTLTALIEAANRKALSILQSRKFSMEH